MKKYIFSIIFTIGLICNTEITEANDACTRAWGNSVNYIVDRHLEAQIDCALGSVLDWYGGINFGSMISSILNS